MAKEQENRQALHARSILPRTPASPKRNARRRLKAAGAELDALTRLQEDAGRIQKIATEQMQRRPNDPGLHHEVGVISLRVGAVREGLRWLYRALEIDPKHAPTHRALAEHYQRLGNAALAARHRRLAETAGRSGP